MSHDQIPTPAPVDAAHPVTDHVGGAAPVVREAATGVRPNAQGRPSSSPEARGEDRAAVETGGEDDRAAVETGGEDDRAAVETGDEDDRAAVKTGGEDDRRQTRVTINKEFESFDAFIQEYVTNISRTGAFIKSRAPLGIGTKVNLCFTVIMDDIETIEGVGEVVRVEENPPGMGVVFREISAYSKGLIDRLLTQGFTASK